MTDTICLPDQSAPRPAHSPLGASGAERWMECPGSVTLIQNLALEPSDEPEWTAQGTAAHAAAAHCLENGLDTWEIVGQTFEGVKLDTAQCDAINVYVSHVRQYMGPEFRHFIEFGISSPVHPDFYGTLDFGSIWYGNVGPLRIIDYKNGEGIVVEPEENPQLMYYGYGLIEQHPEWSDDTPVELTIVQPRAFHQVSTIRTWETTVGYIKGWVQTKLVPAMLATAFDHKLDAGPWCRFCPAKLTCPLLTSLFGAAARHDPKAIHNMDDDEVGRQYQYSKAVKFYLKALEDEAFNRLSHGKVVEGVKLVNKKSNRVWNAGAPAEAKRLFGDDAMTKPELLSPAQLEGLSPKAKLFVKEHAYHPDTGLTVALASDPKPAVIVKSASDAFAAALAAIKAEQENA